MVHTFQAGGLLLAMDVASGALHLLDDLSDKVVPLYMEYTQEEILFRLKDSWPEGEIRSCLSELARLEQEGMLFSPMVEEPLPPDDGIVKALCLHVAHDCNLRCGYCFASTGGFHGTRSLMPLEVGKKALDFLVEKSGSREHLEVDFFGGEPMMNFPVVEELVAYGRQLERAHGKYIAFTMTTNCYHLPEGAAGFLNREMENVVLSLDGREAVHDAVRPNVAGEGSYRHALGHAKAIVDGRAEGEYYVRGTFTNRNLDFASDVESLFDAGFQHVSVEPVVLEQGHPLALGEEHLSRIDQEYDRLLEICRERKRRGMPHLFFHFSVDLSGGPCLRKRLSGCGCGREYLAVTPEGDLYPCHQFVGRKGFLLGNVMEGRVLEGKRDAFLENHVGEKEICQSCWAKYLCAGGCAANAQSHSGNILTPNPLECHMLKKRTECALALAAWDLLEG